MPERHTFFGSVTQTRIIRSAMSHGVPSFFKLFLVRHIFAEHPYNCTHIIYYLESKIFKSAHANLSADSPSFLYRKSSINFSFGFFLPSSRMAQRNSKKSSLFFANHVPPESIRFRT